MGYWSVAGGQSSGQFGVRVVAGGLLVSCWWSVEWSVWSEGCHSCFLISSWHEEHVTVTGKLQVFARRCLKLLRVRKTGQRQGI